MTMLNKGKFNQHDADILTLGSHIARTMQLKSVANNFYAELAHKFCSYEGVTDQSEIHKMLKRLLIGNDDTLMIELVNFILQYEMYDTIVSKPIRITNWNAALTLTVFKNAKLLSHDKHPFYIKDFCYFCNTFVALDDVESVGYGEGKKLMSSVLSKIEVPMLGQAGFLHYGDYEIEARDVIDSGVIDKLVAYYESLGFKNVNDHIGSYEDSVVMLYSKEDVFGTDSQEAPKKIELW